MLENLSFLYKFCDAQQKLKQLYFWRSQISLVYATVPTSVTEALNILPTQLLQVKVTKLDEDGNFLMQSNSQPAWKTGYRNRSLLFSVAGNAKTELNAKNCQSEQKGNIYFVTILKKRKTKTFSLKTGANVGT